MSDPLNITSATIQFMGFRSAFGDILQVIRFSQSSQEHNSDLSWLVGSVRWELESLDQWGRYVGLHQGANGSTPTAKPPLLASPSAWRRIVDLLAGCRSTILELDQLLPHNPEGHSTSPSSMQIQAHPTLETLQYTEKITNSIAVVAVMEPYDSGGQSSTLDRIRNCFTQNKDRIKELVDRLAVSNRRLKEEIPNPDVFYRWLASAFGELEIDELQQMRPSDTIFRRFLDALIFEKQNSYLLKSDHVDNNFKMKLPSVPKMVNAPLGSHTRGLGRSAAGRWVLVEWKRVTQTTPGFRPKVKKRLDNLARCLHPGEKSQRSDFHMMSCDGWFEDVDSCWLGLVYQLPPSVDYQQKPLSLAEILDDLPPPSLGVRFKLAYQLAISLQKYHASKWFHKAFNSLNVLFFFDQSSGELCLEDPYVVGFGSSRHKKLDAATGTEGVDPDINDYANLYQHPGVAKGFRAAYDVYALGCIMLELAHWKTLVSLKDDFFQQQTATTGNNNQTWVEALEEMASYLAPKVGEMYEYAVGWCLCDVVTIREDKAIAHFFRQIVEVPLASLHV
jgi:hypothetical protein